MRAPMALMLINAFVESARADMYDFSCREPQGAKLLLIGKEVMIGGPSGPARIALPPRGCG